MRRPRIGLLRASASKSPSAKVVSTVNKAKTTVQIKTLTRGSRTLGSVTIFV